MIRSEKPEDFQEIYNLNKEAFGEASEAILIEKLRKTLDFNPELSLVYIEDNNLIGHSLLYPISIKTKDRLLKEIGLGPVAVKPDYQKRGIGTKLINEGLNKAKQLEYKVAVVLGDTKFYSRFGFESARKNNLKVALDVQQEDFMVLELIPGALTGIHGLVIYNEAFNNI